MITTQAFARLALSLPEVQEQDHWGKPSWRVKGRIFATLHRNENRAVVKLDRGEQAMRCELRPQTFESVASWGHQGWTWVSLASIAPAEAKAVLELAWREVAPKKLMAAADGAVPRPATASRTAASSGKRSAVAPSTRRAKPRPAR